jgi:hypothetical protein
MSSCTSNTPTKIILSYSERSYFEAVVRRATASQRDAFRAQIVLLAARGFNNTQISEELSCTRKTVRKWRDRYAESGRAGLAESPDPADHVSMTRPHGRTSPHLPVNYPLTADFRYLDLVPPIFTTKPYENSTRVQPDQPSPPGSGRRRFDHGR